jgi:hypothetical protein
MAGVLPHVKNPLVFGPEATRAMSVAFDEVCRALNVSYAANDAREAIATRIIESARCGECDPDRLCDRVITEVDVMTPQAFMQPKVRGRLSQRPRRG